MKLRELRNLTNSIPVAYDDAEVVVDTEARCFNSHVIGITNVTADSIPDLGEYVIIHLDTDNTFFSNP